MGIDKYQKKCYVLTTYTTDGSGENHREYKDWEADRLGKKSLGLRLFCFS